MPTLEWSQRRGTASWTDVEGNRKKIETYEGKSRPPQFLPQYLQNGWEFSERRKDQIIKLRKKKEKPPEEAADALLRSIFPHF